MEAQEKAKQEAEAAMNADEEKKRLEDEAAAQEAER